MEFGEEIKAVKTNAAMSRVASQISATQKILAGTNENCGLIPYRRKEKWGFCALDKKIVIDCMYDNANQFSDGLAAVELDGKWGFINYKGQLVIPCRYNFAGIFINGLSKVMINSGEIFKYKVSFIKPDGLEITPFKYDMVFSDLWDIQHNHSIFSNDLEVLHINKMAGYINRYGIEITSFHFEYADCFSSGYAIIWKNRKCGFINQCGDIAIQVEYENARKFSEGLAFVKAHGKWGAINEHEKVIIPFLYEDAMYFKEGLAFVSKLGKWGAIDKTGKEIIPFNYQYYYHEASVFDLEFSDGLCKVSLIKNISKSPDRNYMPTNLQPQSKEERRERRQQLLRKIAETEEESDIYGFINKYSETVIPFVYSNAKKFSNGVARIELNGKWGVINNKGDQIIACQYDSIEDFVGEISKVKIDNKEGYINKQGVEFWDD